MVSAHQFLFSWLDFLIFSVLVGASAIIGIYFGCYSKQNTKEGYLLGERRMHMLPIAISLIASKISSVTLLAVPSDIYRYGANVAWLCISTAIVTLMTCYIFLPIIFPLRITSVFEYFNLRFGRNIQVLASVLFTIGKLLYNPIAIYIPALAFSQVSGIYIHYITSAVSLFCIFYTTIGGIKAVIWTDVLQFVGIIGSTITVLVLGLLDVDGFSNVWKASVAGDRLKLNFDWDPTLKDSFWIIIVGGTINEIVATSLNQGSVQKFLSVKTLSDARKTSILYCFGFIIIWLTCIFMGLIMYTKYANCDPLSSNRIEKPDQIMGYFVMDVAGHIPGIPGLFVAGLLSAGLSTFSANLNTMSSTIYQDFLQPFMPVNITEKQISNILKLIVLVVGIISIAAIFMVEQLGSIYQATVIMQGIPFGPLLGLFVAAIFFPSINSTGALVGGLSGFTFIIWIVTGKFLYGNKNAIAQASKPLSTEGCTFSFNHTLGDVLSITENDGFILYRLSGWYNSMLTGAVIIIVGLVVSLFTKKDKDVDRKLISPLVYSSGVNSLKAEPQALNYKVETSCML